MILIFQIDELGNYFYWLFYYVIWVGIPLLAVCVVTYLLYKFFKNRGHSKSHGHHTNVSTSGAGNPVNRRGSGTKTQLEEIYERLNIVESEIRQLKMQSSFSQTGKAKLDSSSQPTIQRVELTKTEPSAFQQQTNRTTENVGQTQRYSHEGPIETLCQLYNQGVEDSSRRSEFKDRYRPDRIGTANAMARRRDPNIVPEFESANDGEYYAIAEVERGYRYYAVVPKFDLTLQDSNYGPGAMSIVFDCPNYDPQLSYRRVRVVRPAAFERDASQNWRLKTKGELDLGQGERA
jgi:hypothetical protein